MTNDNDLKITVENALLFFELVDTGNGISLQSLKKSYYKKCLQFHPDKNPDGLEQFKQIQTYYDYLMTHIYVWCKDSDLYDSDGNSVDMKHDSSQSSTTTSYMDYLKEYIMSFTNKYDWNKDIVEKSIQLILEGAKTTSLKMFERMNEERAMEIYEYLSKYNTLFQISNTTMESLKSIVEQKTKHKHILYLEPSLDELMHDKIFVYNVNEKDTLYIPLWHNELDYKDNYIVRIHPKLASNITIDDDNNIHYHMKVDMDELFDRDILNFELGMKTFTVNVNSLYIRKYQTVLLKHQGLSQINEYSIFETKKRSHIILHLYIT